MWYIPDIPAPSAPMHCASPGAVMNFRFECIEGTPVCFVDIKSALGNHTPRYSMKHFLDRLARRAIRNEMRFADEQREWLARGLKESDKRA